MWDIKVIMYVQPQKAYSLGDSRQIEDCWVNREFKFRTALAGEVCSLKWSQQLPCRSLPAFHHCLSFNECTCIELNETRILVMAQSVSCRSVTAEVQVSSPVCPCMTFGGRSDSGKGFPVLSVSFQRWSTLTFHSSTSTF